MVLVFDAFIASKFMGTKFSFNHIMGLCIIMLAVVCCAVFSPKAEYEVTAKAMANWASNIGGIIFLVVMFIIVTKGIFLVLMFEKRYPEFPKGREKVPQSTVITMRIVYPAILAVFETMGASSLKGVVGMLMTMSTEEGQLKHPAFWITFFIWIICIANTVIWLRKVYAKYPTAECLPTEIGLVTSFSICSGLLFYKEAQNLQEILIMSACAATIPVGITLMIFGRPRHIVSNGRMLIRSISKKSTKNIHHTVDHMHHLYANARGQGFAFPHTQRALHLKFEESVHALHHLGHSVVHLEHAVIHSVEFALGIHHAAKKKAEEKEGDKVVNRGEEEEAKEEAKAVETPAGDGPAMMLTDASPSPSLEKVVGKRNGGAAKVHIAPDEGDEATEVAEAPGRPRSPAKLDPIAPPNRFGPC
jgi:hypothetical protein